MTDIAVPAALLMLADSRLPAGGHAHSGGIEAAVESGAVADLAGLAAFLRGRLQTVGRVAAGCAARAAVVAGAADVDIGELARRLTTLEGELDARTPSPAAREASRAQGRGLCRAVAALWPDPALEALPPRPHLPVVVGVAAVAVGAGPAAAAQLAALTSITGAASAAVRLLGLDPLRVAALQAGLAADVDAVAAAALDDDELPASSAPGLDLLAQSHQRMEVRLFAS